MKLTVAKKLLAGFLAVASVGALTAAIGIWGLSHMELAMDDAARKKWVIADGCMNFWIGSLSKVWSVHEHLEGHRNEALRVREWATHFTNVSFERLRHAYTDDPETIRRLEEADRRNEALGDALIACVDREQVVQKEFWQAADELDGLLQSADDRIDAAMEKAAHAGNDEALRYNRVAETWRSRIRDGTHDLRAISGLLHEGEGAAAGERIDRVRALLTTEIQHPPEKGPLDADESSRLGSEASSLLAAAQQFLAVHEATVRASGAFDDAVQDLQDLIVPVEHRGDMAMERSMDDAVAAAHRYRIAVILAATCGTLLAVAAGLLIARRVTAPLRDLSRAVRDLATGRPVARVDAGSGDEVGDLAAVFNEMAAQLRESNARLQKSEAAYRNLFDTAVVGLYRADAEGRMQMANRCLLGILGHSPETGHGLDFCLSERFVDRGRWRDFLAAIESQGEARDFPASLRRSDGRQLEALLSARRDPATGTIEGTIQDVTERRMLEQQLVQKEKLSAIGQLAAGISHEMRNPLGIVSNVLYDLRHIVDLENPEVREDLAIATEELNRLNSIISNLLEFARETGTEPEVIDVNRLVERTLQLMAKSFLHQNIQVEARLGDVPPAQFNQNAFKQVFINLVTNATQAMPDGGHLTIRSRLVRGRIELDVGDTGVGISPKDLPRIFNPFFTTKEVGKGTGLGLSIVHSTLHKYDGDIRVESKVGKGTTFTVELPVAPAPAMPRDAGPATRRPEGS